MTKEEEKYTTLDIEQCKWWVNHLFNIAKERAFNANVIDDAKEIQSAQDKIIKLLGQEPCEDAISRKALMSHIESERREWGEDYDLDQLLGDIEDFPSITTTKEGD